MNLIHFNITNFSEYSCSDKYTPFHLIEQVGFCGLKMRWCLAWNSYVQVVHCVLVIPRTLHYHASAKLCILRNWKLPSLPCSCTGCNFYCLVVVNRSIDCYAYSIMHLTRPKHFNSVLKRHISHKAFLKEAIYMVSCFQTSLPVAALLLLCVIIAWHFRVAALSGHATFHRVASLSSWIEVNVFDLPLCAKRRGYWLIGLMLPTAWSSHWGK